MAKKIKKPVVWVLNRSNMLLLTVFVLIFVSNDTFMFGTNSRSIMLEIPRILMGLYIILELLYVLKHPLKKTTSKTIIVGLAMFCLMVFISMYHGDPPKLILIKCLCIASSLLLTLHYNFQKYADAFVKVMVFLAVMALILEGIGYIIPSLAYALPRILNTANNEITTIGFAGFATIYLSTNIIRNFGIFWEPGVFQMYLNWAIMMELFLKKTVSWRNVVLLLAGVFITLSTTGFIVSAWILITYFFLVYRKTITRKSLVVVSIALIVLVAALFILDFTVIHEVVFEKLSDPEDGSWIARSASVFVNLDIFFDHPFLGVGMNQINTELAARSTLMYGRPTTHNTNTLLYQFAAHGIFYAGLFTIGTFQFTRCLSAKKIVQIALIIAMLLIYVGENLRYSMLPFILLFYGYNSSNHMKNNLS